MDHIPPLYWYKLVFMTELLVAEALASYSLKKQEHFAAKVVVSVICLYLIAFFMPILFGNPVFNTFYVSAVFLLLFSASICFMKLCFDENIATLLFCGVVAYTTQHISYSSVAYFLSITRINQYNIYGNIWIDVQAEDWISLVVYLGIYACIYWFVWAFIEHKIREQEKLKVEKLLLFGLVGVLFVDVVLSIAVTYFMQNQDPAAQTIVFLYRLANCVFVYIMLYSVLRKRIAENELEAITQLWEQDRKSYVLSKRNIELINMRCHDLKHQIRKLRSVDGAVSMDYLAELEQNIDIYHNTIRTGNEALDLIIAENAMDMASKQIRFSAMVDGDELSILSPTDIYSLFGNALSNAIEAVEEIEDPEKRVIRLRVRREADMLLIHTENSFNSILLDEKGLPKTTKTGEGHGYGLRSMQLIAEKYQGILTVSVEDSLFCLDILFPIESKASS